MPFLETKEFDYPLAQGHNPKDRWTYINVSSCVSHWYWQIRHIFFLFTFRWPCIV